MIRRWLGVPLLFVFVALTSFGQAPDGQSLANMKRDLFYLASDECEGRGPGTKGLDLAATYIAKQFADAGLKPGGVDGGFFQPFSIKGSSTLEQPNTLVFTGPDKKSIAVPLDKSFQVMGLSGSKKVDAPLVFVGYGLQTNFKYDDYVGIDMAGKIVVLFRRVPRFSSKNNPFGAKRDVFAALKDKVALAEANKAAAVILVNDATEKDDQLPPFSFLALETPSGIPCVHVKRAAIDPIFQSGLGMSLKDVEKAIDDDFKPRSGPLKGWTASVETHVSRPLLPVKNVIAVLDGQGPLAKETVVVGAHYDHLGYGGPGSLAKGATSIHYGADDNASGTTAVMELARRYANRKDRQGRKLVFMTFSAEERGLLGSRFFCKEPIFPLADIAAMVNIDMVGKLRPDTTTKKDKLIVQGIGTAKNFDPLVAKLNSPDFTFSKVQTGENGRSDHSSFYDKKIPVLFFWTGTHPDYHRPSDTPDRINYEGMKKVVDYVDSVVGELASDPNRPKFIEVKSQGKVASGAPIGPRLGVTPNYESEKEGLLLDGVSSGGAAEKAGLKAGDRIVEIAGKTVTNVETYMVIMSQQRVGEAIEINILRDGKKMALKVTPQITSG